MFQVEHVSCTSLPNKIPRVAKSRPGNLCYENSDCFATITYLFGVFGGGGGSGSSAGLTGVKGGSTGRLGLSSVLVRP